MDTRLDVVRALSLTGSRAAVTLLIRLLQSPEGRISSFAEYGLEALTHLRGAKMDGIHPPPPTAYSKWIRWLMTDGQTATIFRPDQCGEIKRIPDSASNATSHGSRRLLASDWTCKYCVLQQARSLSVPVDVPAPCIRRLQRTDRMFLPSLDIRKAALMSTHQ
jgi:hypothetical protein